MRRLWRSLRELLNRDREEGAAMVEYALLVALVAMGTLLGLSNLGTTMRKVFTGAANTIAGVPSNAR